VSSGNPDKNIVKKENELYHCKERGITMTTVKTAISLQESLFTEVETLANELNIPRSCLFALVMEEFIARHKQQQLLSAINEAFDDAPDEEEKRVQTVIWRLVREVAAGFCRHFLPAGTIRNEGIT